MVRFWYTIANTLIKATTTTMIMMMMMMMMIIIIIIIIIMKFKVHPRKGHEDPEGEQMYSSTLPSALDGGGWSMTRSGRFTPGK